MVVSHYDLSVLSRSVIGLDRGMGGWGELHPILLGFLFYFAKRVSDIVRLIVNSHYLKYRKFWITSRGFYYNIA